MQTMDPLEAVALLDVDWERLGTVAGVRAIICALGGFRRTISVQRAGVQALVQLSTRRRMLKAAITAGGVSAVVASMSAHRKDEALQALGLELLSAVALHYILDPAQLAQECWYGTVLRAAAAHPRSEDVRLFATKTLCALLCAAAPPPPLLPQAKRLLVGGLGRLHSGEVQRCSLYALSLLTHCSTSAALTQPNDVRPVVALMTQHPGDTELQAHAVATLANSMRGTPAAVNAVAATKALEATAAVFRSARSRDLHDTRLAACSVLVTLLHAAPPLRTRAVAAGCIDAALQAAVTGATVRGEGDVGASACALLALLLPTVAEPTKSPQSQQNVLERAAETLLGVLRANTESEALQNFGCYALRCALRTERVKNRVVALGGPALLAEVLVGCPHPYAAEALVVLVSGGSSSSSSSSRTRKEAVAGAKGVLEAVGAAAERRPDVVPAAALFFREMFTCDNSLYEKIKGRGKFVYRGANTNVRRVLALMGRVEDPAAVEARSRHVCSKVVAAEMKRMKKGDERNTVCVEKKDEEMCQRFKKCTECNVLLCESCWESGPHKTHNCIELFAIGKCEG